MPGAPKPDDLSQLFAPNKKRSSCPWSWEPAGEIGISLEPMPAGFALEARRVANMAGLQRNEPPCAPQLLDFVGAGGRHRIWHVYPRAVFLSKCNIALFLPHAISYDHNMVWLKKAIGG